MTVLEGTKNMEETEAVLFVGKGSLAPRGQPDPGRTFLLLLHLFPGSVTHEGPALLLLLAVAGGQLGLCGEARGGGSISPLPLPSWCLFLAPPLVQRPWSMCPTSHPMAQGQGMGSLSRHRIRVSRAALAALCSWLAALRRGHRLWLFLCQFCWAGGGSAVVWRQLWGHGAGTGQWQRRGTQWGPHGERDFVGIGSALSIDPVMQIFLPASNAIINLIWSVHEIKCFFEDEITLQGLF